MNVPNLLTVLRVIAIPFFMVFLLTDHGTAAGIIFILASITDALDGKIARKYNLITNFGKIMDPLADKLLVTAALVCFVDLGVVASWMVVVILAREFAITGLRAVAAGEGIIIAAGWSGKIKTVTQMAAIILLLFQDTVDSLFASDQVSAIWYVISQLVLWIAVIMTIYSGIEYIYKNRKLFLS